MTTETTTRTPSNGQPRKTLASQIDRLDGILDGLDAALAGAVQDAVEQAVKQAVQAVLAEVLTNRQLQEELQRASQTQSPPEERRDNPRSVLTRIWQATTAGVRRTVQSVKQLGRGVGMALLAAGSVVVGLVYAARAKIASLAKTVYRHGKRLVQGAVSFLTDLWPSFAFGG